MKTTINANLSSHVVTADGLYECYLPIYNPETQIPFTSTAEVKAFISTISPNYFMSVPTATEIATAAAQVLLDQRKAAKVTRQIKVDAILVTTTAGNVFNGDEKSQDRMARAIIALNAQPQSPVPTIIWTLANNLPVAVTAAELTEALALAGAAQSAIWII